MPFTMTTAALQQLPLWNEGAIDAAWRVRRSARARRLGVRIFRDGTVEIVVPPGAGARAVSAFVTRHRDWIERHRQRAPRADFAFPPARIELPAIGESWACQPGATGTWVATEAAGVRRGPLLRPHATGGAGGVLELRCGTDDPALRAGLLEWLCERAGLSLAPQLAALAADCGVRYQRLQIRRQRTRWGSCSARGTISLNCCLLFHRPPVVRYLLVHELAHLTHMNHSARFWQLVERHEPQWREYDRELAAGWSQVPGWVLQTLRA
jgi:predicted metal-dependent hydrolase